MSFQNKLIIVTESESELQDYLEQYHNKPVALRIKMLLLMKKNLPKAISGKTLGNILNVHERTINIWRNTYLRDGINGVLRYTKHCGRPIVLTHDIAKFIEDTLKNPENRIYEYEKLRRIINEKFGRNIKYSTLHAFCTTKLNFKIKTMRKSHT